VSATLAALARHPFAPFALLYAAAASFGLCWGIARGNDLVQGAGQTLTAVLFLVGFCWAAPRLHALATARFWMWFLVAVAALSVPGLLSLASKLAADPDQFVRFLVKTDFYAFVGLLIAIAVAAPRRPAARWWLAGFFALLTLVTFTRSYWLGAAVGLVLLGLMSVRDRHGLRVPRLRSIAIVAGLAALVAASPIGGFARDRVTSPRAGGDTSADQRGLELSAAIRQIEQTPFAGVGSGGEFTSVHQTSDSTTAYGPINFTHNAYLYFPLKFGLLGFAAVVALLIGLVQCAWTAMRPGGTTALADRAWLAVLAAILAASLTAPNLVDPLYSTFCGAVAGLAGLALAPRPESAVGDRSRAESEPAWA
jgi:O-antigen ligase